jgi:phosphoenolpyruvate synthase/pyruvate phosphate dikinase
MYIGMSMDYIHLLKEIGKDDVATAGGKGASLGEMTQAQIPVPPGCVVTAQAFDKFLEETDLNVELDAILDQVDRKAMHSIEEASEKIHALILGATIPKAIADEIAEAFGKLGAKYVAVRSSATAEDSKAAAWAGQLESYLNVIEVDLPESVKKCWASLFTPRAIFYRFEQGLHGKHISVAVVIQKMVESEVSGVAFSVHPVTQDHDQLVIEAVFGLGEAIVQGIVTPDSFVIEKSGWGILDKNSSEQKKGMFRRGDENEWFELSESDGKKPKLSDKEALELAKLITKIEGHYGFPVDVEWAREGGKFFITQSRPITTLVDGEQSQGNKYEFSWGERHSVISTEAWLRGYIDLRDVIANESKNVFMYVENGQVNTYNAAKDMQLALEAGEAVLDHSFLKTHLKQSKLIREQFTGLYEGVKERDLSKLGSDGLADIFEQYEYLFDKTWAHFKVSQPEYLERAKERLEALIKEKSSGKGIETSFITLTTPTETDPIKEEEVAALNRSLADVTDEVLWQHAEEYPWLFFNTYNRDVIQKFLREKFNDLQAMSERERHHHIEKAETDLEKHKKEHDGLLQELGSNPDISYLADVFGDLAVDRLRMKAWWGGAEYLFLTIFEEIAERAGISSEDLLMSYKVDDIMSFLRDGTKLTTETIESRKKLYAVAVVEGAYKFYEKAEAKEKFDALIGDDGDEAEAVDEIKGVVANVGKAKGKARIIVVEDLKRLLEDMERFKEGEVMVTTMTQPTMVSLARKAAAIVTNEGGITSHASILAREYDIPCIVGTKTATFVIKDGDEVEVDANKGIVRKLKQ